MPRLLYNATVIPEIIELIAKKYAVSENEAMDLFYRSSVVQALNDPETRLYGQSALYIFSLFIQEKKQTVDEQTGRREPTDS